MQQKHKESCGETGKGSASGPSDLVVGTVLFIIFIIFMAGWMMYRLP